MRSRRKRTLLSFQRPVPLWKRRRKKASDSRQRPPKLCDADRIRSRLGDTPVRRGTRTFVTPTLSGGRRTVANPTALSSRLPQLGEAPLARLQRRIDQLRARDVEVGHRDTVQFQPALADQPPRFARREPERGR